MNGHNQTHKALKTNHPSTPSTQPQPDYACLDFSVAVHRSSVASRTQQTQQLGPLRQPARRQNLSRLRAI